MSFLDLQGVSGALYRFRRVEDQAALPAHGGNFVTFRPGQGGRVIPACGTSRSLMDLAARWRELTADGCQLLVRLNVTRAVRLAEHDDLATALNPAKELREPD